MKLKTTKHYSKVGEIMTKLVHSYSDGVNLLKCLGRQKLPSVETFISSDLVISFEISILWKQFKISKQDICTQMLNSVLK